MGHETRASEMYQRAVSYFRAARSGEFVNAYPFYSEAWMFYQRARSSVGPIAITHIAEAFQVLDEAAGNVAGDDMSAIEEMEAKLVRFLSEFSNLSRELESLRLQNEPTVNYLEARYASVGSSKAYSKERAYSIVSDSLKRTPNYVPCLRLASHLHHILYPEDFAGWKAILDRLYRLEEPQQQCGTLFNLGYTACQLGDYNEALGYFEDLERESLGHPRRSGILEVVKDGRSDRRLTGCVIAVRSRTEGWLRSEVMMNDVKFIPRAQKFSVQNGQSVTFVLALNYRGCLAIDLRPE